MPVIQAFLEKHHIKAQALAIGVSGGADSLALALMFKEACPHIRLIALTVDHGLRPTSRQEAVYVAEVMKKHDIEHHILVWEGEKPKTAIEEQARLARYDLLCQWCQSNHIQYLAIAHHLFDQAETFLMRLERGSGLYGLSSMQEISEKNGIQILRPLLHTSPVFLKSYLNEKNIPWVEDESNHCADFLRVKMRQFLPTFSEQTGITAERLDLAITNLQHVRKFIDDATDRIIKEKVHFWGDDACAFDYAEFLSWHKELRFYVIQKLILKITHKDYSPEAFSLNALLQDIEAPDFQGATLGGVYFQNCDLRIWLIAETRQKYPPLSEDEWQDFLKKNPSIRGIKIPSKLKQVLYREKNHKK